MCTNFLKIISGTKVSEEYKTSTGIDLYFTNHEYFAVSVVDNGVSVHMPIVKKLNCKTIKNQQNPNYLDFKDVIQTRKIHNPSNINLTVR